MIFCGNISPKMYVFAGIEGSREIITSNLDNVRSIVVPFFV